jgi:hypothetical protein
MKIVKIILISIFLFSGLVDITLAAVSSCTTLEIHLPGVGKKVGDHWEVCGPADYLSGIYKLSLGIGVFLAAMVIVMAGIKYATAGDNSGKQKEAREDISQAIFGLLILFGSVVILRTIDPNLADLGKLQSMDYIPQSTPISFEEQVECSKLSADLSHCFDTNCSGKVPSKIQSPTGWIQCCSWVACAGQRDALNQAGCTGMTSSSFDEEACSKIYP